MARKNESAGVVDSINESEKVWDGEDGDAELAKSPEPETLQEAVEGEIRPDETARERLERLEREYKAAQAAVREESKRKREQELALATESIEPQIKAMMREIEEKTGKVFRAFTVRYTNKQSDPAEMVTKYVLVTPRQRDS